MYVKGEVHEVRRTKEEAGETKQKIIDAAVTLFETKGYNATRIEDIAEKTGMTRGAVYWHFKNKDELYTYIFEMFERRLDLLITESRRETRSPLGRLRWLMVKIITRSDLLVGIRQLRVITTTTLSQNKVPEMHQRAKKIFGKYMRTIERVIQDGIAAGEVKGCVDVGNAALMLAVFVTGAVGAHLDELKLASSQWDADSIVDLVLNGIRV
jgi:TetR/AcrR family acrAB operon transcriptional repressor